MIQKSPLCFEVYLKGDTHSLLKLNSSISGYENLLSSLAQICEQFTFSLRHLYDPSGNQKLRFFIIINPSSQLYGHEMSEKIEGLIRGSLNRFYNFTHEPEVFKQLNWVSSIGEIVKHEEFVEKPEFIGYLPHIFYTELISDKFSILELLEAASEKLVLEFSLETYDSPSEQAHWREAIEDLVNRLSNYGSKSNSAKDALELYRHYQDNYTENQLFKYSFKALGCNAIDAVATLQALLGLVGKASTRQNNNIILTSNPNNSTFKDNLEATQNVRVFQNIRWNGWENRIGRILEKKLTKETVKSSGLLGSFDDNSLIFPILPSNLEKLYRSQEIDNTLPTSNESMLNLNSSDLLLGGNTSVSRIFEMQIPKVEHLKPLQHITTFQEIFGFMKIFQPSVVYDNPATLPKESIDPRAAEQVKYDSSNTLHIQDIVQKYKNKITEDTYIVGVYSNGDLCISNWEKSPHRLVAGTTGSGKTSYCLFSLIYQLLYANSKAKIFLADFQAGLHFNIISNQYESVELVTHLEDFAKLLKRLVDEHESRRDVMIHHKSRSRLQLQQKSGIKLDRNFLIIDEAFFIQNADATTKKEIEKHLTTLAAQARVTGIHIVYCSQSPNLLNKQIKACIEERIVFRVANNNESLGWLDNFSALNLDNGMAVYRGRSYDPKSPKIVSIPFVPDETWDSPIC